MCNLPVYFYQNPPVNVQFTKIFLQNFVVRKSSQSSTMAISVRLPTGKGPYIEHYLIQVYEDGQFGLESSDNKFPTIPLLIAYYCQCWWVFCSIFCKITFYFYLSLLKWKKPKLNLFVNYLILIGSGRIPFLSVKSHEKKMSTRYFYPFGHTLHYFTSI